MTAGVQTTARWFGTGKGVTSVSRVVMGNETQTMYILEVLNLKNVI